MTRLPANDLQIEVQDPRFSDDKFGILVSCSSDQLEEVENILRDMGSEEIQINGVKNEE